MGFTGLRSRAGNIALGSRVWKGHGQKYRQKTLHPEITSYWALRTGGSEFAKAGEHVCSHREASLNVKRQTCALKSQAGGDSGFRRILRLYGSFHK